MLTAKVISTSTDAVGRSGRHNFSRCSFEIDGPVCVPPVQGIRVFWNLNLPQTARNKG